MIRNHLVLFTLYLVALLFYSFWSYSLTDPNLVLTSWPVYWHFQQWMWQTFFHNPSLLTAFYAVTILAIFIPYLLMLKFNKFRQLLIPLILVCLVLAFSYNALSHDVFNYIFNAKMLVTYHADPHTQVALNFADDPWLRFMHNTHTPAPYGYTWTIISILPYILGLGKFTLTLFVFRLWEILALISTYLILKKHSTKKLNYLFLLFFNPLILIEIISNGHNDLWMLTPAVLSFLIINKILQLKKITSSTSILAMLSLGLLLFSASIKIATIVLIPIWVVLFLSLILKSYNLLNQQYQQIVNNFWPLICSLLMFLPLFTLRSQQFHPWYLSWSMIWFIFFHSADAKVPQNRIYPLWLRVEKIWMWAVVILSLASMLRYLPFLYYGQFDDQVLLMQKLITWVPFILALIVGTILTSTHKFTKK